ncbi:hypothetical protein [Bradyrhizobium sp. USDA 4529]
MDSLKTAIVLLQLPHWLIAAGALLVIVGVIGHAISRRRRKEVEDEPDSAPSPEPRPQMAPLPDLLDSKSRKDRGPKPD